ncbi:hypothetical protein HQN87_17590 [Paenibacillus tritici]|uniref:Uncharacterized protein n=1 Tax=Paenibacillus tritici TaxID=1873425 RepID=A0ABX2DSK9_9BACL|nr:hypothetical protein [Paenibacillus tritici]NQX47147.1 hypothetical protein [Paenibacillus tritici]
MQQRLLQLIADAYAASGAWGQKEGYKGDSEGERVIVRGIEDSTNERYEEGERQRGNEGGAREGGTEGREGGTSNIVDIRGNSRR